MGEEEFMSILHFFGSVLPLYQKSELIPQKQRTSPGILNTGNTSFNREVDSKGDTAVSAQMTVNHQK